MNTTEKNSLMAEFLGANNSFQNGLGEIFLDSIPNPEGGTMILRVSSLKYHSDWNWLMQVVEKILNLKNVYAEKRQKLFNSISPNIETTYNACVQFVQWYNQQKQ